MRRIVYIHQYFVTPAMSGGIRTYEFARRLAADGYDVHVICSDAKNIFSGWKTEIESGITIHWVSVAYSNNFSRGKRMRAFIKFLYHASCAALRLRPDLVIATSTPLSVAIPALIVRILRGTRYIFEVRDLWPEIPDALGFLPNPILRRLSYLLASITYRYASHIVALSPGMAEGIAKYGNYRSKLTVIPNASDTHLLRSDGNLQPDQMPDKWFSRIMDRPVLVYTGTIGFVNDLSYLVRLARELSQRTSNVAIAVFGQGGEKGDIVRLAEELGVLDENMFFFESVSKKQLRNILGYATASISTVRAIPELWANSANKFFDAFAAGIPIVINHEGWQADIILSSGSGLVLSHFDITRAATDLHCFMNNKDRLNNSRQASKKLGDIQFNRDNLYASLRKIVSTILV